MNTPTPSPAPLSARDLAMSPKQLREIARIWRVCTEINVTNGYQSKRSARRDYLYASALERRAIEVDGRK